MKKIALIILSLVWSFSYVYAGDAPGLRVNKLTQSTVSWDGNTLPAYPSGQPEVTILRIGIPPGARLPMHQHPVINAGVLLKGSLTVVTQDGQTLHLSEGDPIVEVVGNWHYGKNESDLPAEIIVFYAGIRDNPITVKSQ